MPRPKKQPVVQQGPSEIAASMIEDAMANMHQARVRIAGAAEMVAPEFMDLYTKLHEIRMQIVEVEIASRSILDKLNATSDEDNGEETPPLLVENRDEKEVERIVQEAIEQDRKAEKAGKK